MTSVVRYPLSTGSMHDENIVTLFYADQLAPARTATRVCFAANPLHRGTCEYSAALCVCMCVGVCALLHTHTPVTQKGREQFQFSLSTLTSPQGLSTRKTWITFILSFNPTDVRSPCT
ncbi:unnamed protein product [Boreogadus saida]